jgi:hypothetical protein
MDINRIHGRIIPVYIWTNKDSKNAEFTYYIRCSGKISGRGIAANHVTCSSKFRGGVHTGKHDPQASCCELVLRVGEGNASLNYNFEYNHPDYVNDEDGIKKLQANNDTEIGKWFGRKTIVWTNSDGKSVTARDYIDLDPFSANGKRYKKKYLELSAEKQKMEKNITFLLSGVECV